MSRIGKLSIPIPKEVKVNIKDNTIFVTGPKGSLNLAIPETADVKMEGSEVKVLKKGDTADGKRVQGLIRSLINNMINGVAKGFEKKLEIVGVGFKADVKDDIVTFALGFSHPVNYNIPAGIKVAVEKQTALTVSGADKQLVGSVAADIRSLRKPEPYKGKGIRYKDETLKKKVGKTGKK